ncbi:hypothetical protein BCR39DRAFT_523564 [Naematelia encephala]|uniref:Dynactin subunit 6 n=1 Tax=Naematelia encephala TaxID=71784 RepID=A0A1Y2BBP6_9TREE|nr:hypothetical protein BCR39DRAFT_523564 [Naematelia encephala]
MSRSVQPAKITAHSTVLLSQDTDLRGHLTFGAGCVVHPKACILALGGPIEFGRDCVIEELAVVVNRGKDVMRIGDANVFQVACRIEAPSIGNGNTFQPRSRATSNVHISDNCTLSAGTVCLPLVIDLEPGTTETLPSYTVIHSSLSERRIWDGTGQSAEDNLKEKHIEYLREIMPKYNRMRVI